MRIFYHIEHKKNTKMIATNVVCNPICIFSTSIITGIASCRALRHMPPLKVQQPISSVQFRAAQSLTATFVWLPLQVKCTILRVFIICLCRC